MHAEKEEIYITTESNLEVVDVVVVVNKTKLLESLSQIKLVTTQEALVKATFELKHRLIHADAIFGDLVTPEIDGESIEVNKNFLLAELDQIAKTFSLERARYYLERLEKGITKIKTSSINDINLNRWKEYDDIQTDSLWIIERRDNSGVHSAGYWGNFVPQIPNQMLKRYTKQGEWVLDTFAGCGTTLIESQRLGRNSIGIELQQAVVDKAKNFIATEPNKQNVTSEIISGDSACTNYQEILQKHGQKSVQLVIMHPPYFDIIKFSDDPKDLSNTSSVESFLKELSRVAENAASVLDKGRYLVLVIGDKYAHGEWIPLGFLAMNQLTNLGFSLKSIIVKNFEQTTGKRQQKELWKYRALVGGFYIFKHEYIFLLQKR